MLAHELAQAAVPEQAVAVFVDVDAVRRAGGLAVEEHAEGGWLSRCAKQHEMRVAGVEPVGDAPAGLVEPDTLAPDRPLAGQGPVVEPQPIGELVRAALVERGAVR